MPTTKRPWKIARNVVLAGVAVCVAVAVWWTFACKPEQSPFRVEDQARADFVGLPGSIGVTLIDYQRERHRYTIRKGEAAAVENLPSPVPTSTDQGSESRSPIPPAVDGYWDEGPIAYDRTGRYVVTALSRKPATGTFRVNTVVRVVDTSTDESLFVFDDGNRWFIQALAWAPDSSAVAVIRGEYKRRYCFLDMLMAMSGHPAWVETHHLFVLSRDGRVLAKTTLMDNATTDRLELVWLN